MLSCIHKLSMASPWQNVIPSSTSACCWAAVAQARITGRLSKTVMRYEVLYTSSYLGAKMDTQPCCSSRRTFLAGLATFGAGALLSKDELFAQAAAPHRIDV